MKILITLILSILGAILYRLGGQGKPFNTKYRDFGVPLCGVGILLTWWQPINLIEWLMLISHFGFSFASMTTYWDELFGYDNFYFHGGMAGLSAFPLFWAGIHWWAILISAVICGLLMGIWNNFVNKKIKREKRDIWDERGRGFIYCITRLLLLILR